MTFDYTDAGLDQPIWNLCAALAKIPDVDIIWSQKGVSQRAKGSYSISLAIWDIEALNFLGTVIGHDETKVCISLSSWDIDDGSGREMDDPLTMMTLLGGPSPAADELATTILEHLGR